MNTTAQKATWTELKDACNGKAHRLENGGFMGEYTIIDPKQERAIVTLRTYCKTGARWTACIWINDPETQTHASGSGQATGYGYCRESAAAADAIETAGIELAQRIDGVGPEAIREALLAIAATLHPRRKMILHKSHA